MKKWLALMTDKMGTWTIKRTIAGGVKWERYLEPESALSNGVLKVSIDDGRRIAINLNHPTIESANFNPVSWWTPERSCKQRNPSV